jgi:hypothetical protein
MDHEQRLAALEAIVAKQRAVKSSRYSGIMAHLMAAPEYLNLEPPYSGVTTQRSLIGSIRRECLDHVVVFGERHLRQVLLSYMHYYNGAWTRLSLNKDAPLSRAVQAVWRILPTPILGGLHHHYVRI